MILDVTIKSSFEGLESLTQDDTGRQLDELGVTQREWICGTGHSRHVWRVWVDGATETAIRIKFKSVNDNYYQSLLQQISDQEEIIAIANGKITELSNLIAGKRSRRRG